MTQELKRRKHLPVAIEKYLAVLQQYGNFGSHDQESDKDDISSEISATIMRHDYPIKICVGNPNVGWTKAQRSPRVHFKISPNRYRVGR